MSKKGQKVTGFIAVFLLMALTGFYISRQFEFFHVYERCARCAELEEWEIQHHNTLPYYKGTIVVTAGKSIKFTDLQATKTYTVLPCDRACVNNLYQQVARHYSFARQYKDTLWLGIWGLKDEAKGTIDMKAYVLAGHTANP